MSLGDLRVFGSNAAARVTQRRSVRLARMAGVGLPLVLLVACADRQQLSPGETATATPAQLRAIVASTGVAQTDPSITSLRRAAGASPGDAPLQARFAAALARAGELAGAEDVLAAALAANPDHPALLNQLGRLRLRSGAPEVALALFERAAPADRGHESLEGRGIALDLLGRHEEAQDAYRAALVVAPQQASVQNNLAMSLLLTGRAGEAVALLEPLAARRDVSPRIANNLAVARGMTGEASRTGPGADSQQIAETATNLRSIVGAAPARPAARDTLLAAPNLPPTSPVFAATVEPAPLAQGVPVAAAATPERTEATPASEPPPIVVAALPPPAAVPAAAPPASVQAAIPAEAQPQAPVLRAETPRATAPRDMLRTAALPPAISTASPQVTADAEPQSAPAFGATQPAEFRSGRFTVQLAALASEEAARAYWANLQAQSPGWFAEREPEIFRAEVNQAVFWRVRAAGFGSLADARSFCEVLRSARRACWVPSS